MLIKVQSFLGNPANKTSILMSLSCIKQTIVWKIYHFFNLKKKSLLHIFLSES